MNTTKLEVIEFDEAGNIVTTYIHSDTPDQKGSRVDVILPERAKGYWQQLLDIFLPAGYPQSVTEDYLEYQIYDSLQAFSSSIAGLLSSRAVLEGVGVGDASASPTAALLLSVLQDSMGRIATILFAHKLGTSLEPECKMYRLAADIFNDTAMILDCLSPVFPKAFRVLILSFSSILRALCGVAAGSSKASLSSHFARWGNLGELNAKDSSQETIISLMGMLAGSLVVSWVSSPFATWSTLILLLSVHLATNHAAVRAVSMRSLNRQRANIVMSHWIQHGSTLSPVEVSKRERIFERDGVLRWADNQVIGYCRIGVDLRNILKRLGPSHEKTRSVQLEGINIYELMQLYTDESYIMWFDASNSEALIVLKKGSTATDQLRAWMHALMLAWRAKAVKQRMSSHAGARLSPADTLLELDLTLRQIRETFPEYAKSLRSAGWDLEIPALETRSGTRTVVKTPE
ncbi:DUF647-domain-containing protein [Lepidopterella palustris CBS 459.81]|uniref:DUF647-domain-containing protein n=1 Tax=Lepidopterella palustris CBS 459.81 TaxID=1314670 RepID=A0A8E2EBV7_9PEZI|nr:DUF647-domain-containing protein [Lepidopterella palustris CBS 459.81]